MNNLPNFAIPFTSVATPKSEFTPDFGTTRWSEDGRRLLEYNWGDRSNVYIGHYFEMVPVYSEDMEGENAGKPTGEMKESCNAMMLVIDAPVTREKIFNAAINEIYVLNGLQEQLEFTQKMLNGTIEGNEGDEIKMYKEIANWVNWQLDIWSGLTLDQAKAKMISEIDAYDTSDAVNQFYLAGVPMWLAKSERVGLVNSTNIQMEAQKAQGVEMPMTTLWYGTMQITLPCAVVLQMLSALELYSLAAFNVTASHKAAVEEMGDIADVLSYDYTTGYPEKLNLSMEQLSSGHLPEAPGIE